MKKNLLLFLFLLAVPIIGWGIGAGIQADIDSKLAKQGLVGSHEACNNPKARSSAKLKSFCDQIDEIEILKKGSIYTGIAGLMLPFIFWVSSILIGESRSSMANFFPPLVRVSLLSLAVLILIQGVIFVYSIYIGESYLLGRVHLFLIGTIGIGALFVFITLSKYALTLGGKSEAQVEGKLLAKSQYPKIYKVVDMLAEKLGATSPDNIIVGLDTTYFVTSAKVKVPNREEPVEGETLYLSLPLSRLLTLEELIAIIGHELGHFRGNDTIYSLKFAPVYAGIQLAIDELDTNNNQYNLMQLMALPAHALLSFMHDVFATKERTIGRERELAADRTAVEVSSPEIFARSLIKVALFSSIWEQMRHENLDRLNQGRVTQNLSLAFANSVRYDVDHNKVELHINDILEVKIPHPTDTHPPIGQRLRSIAKTIPKFTIADLKVPENSAIEAIEDYLPIEEELTLVEHKVMVAAGLAQLPNEEEQSEEQQSDQIVLNAFYTLTAAFVTADGRIDDNEISVAENKCRELLPTFDAVDFREYCYHPENLPDPMPAAEILSSVLTDEGKSAVLRLLSSIANADNNLSAEEIKLLRQVESVFYSAAKQSQQL